MAEQAVSIERAISNAVISTEMEGFKITEEHHELMRKVLNKEITLAEAIENLNKKYA